MHQCSFPRVLSFDGRSFTPGLPLIAARTNRPKSNAKGPAESCRHSPTHNIPQHFATLRRGTTEPLPRCLNRSAIRRWTPSPHRKSLSAPRHLFPDTLPQKLSTPTAAMDVPRSNKQPTSTPQNTPANAAPISSRAQQPTVGTINEGMSPSLFCSVVLLPLPTNPALRRCKYA